MRSQLRRSASSCYSKIVLSSTGDLAASLATSAAFSSRVRFSLRRGPPTALGAVEREGVRRDEAE
eukprot:8181934-Alexandrium_andersonii.AAC.1